MSRTAISRYSGYIGAGPQALQGQNSGSGEAMPFQIESYQTPILDFSKTYSNIELIPARPGYFPVQLLRNWVIVSRSGTQTTPPTCRIGSNATHDNFTASSAGTPSNANVNSADPVSLGSGPGGTNAVQMIPGATIFFDLTSPAVGTGGYRCLARYQTTVYWMPNGET